MVAIGGGEALGCVIGAWLYDIGSFKIQIDGFAIVVVLCATAFLWFDKKKKPIVASNDEKINGINQPLLTDKE